MKLMFFLSVILNFILFYIIFFKEPTVATNEHKKVSYKYVKGDRKLYSNKKCFVTFRENSCNHQVFERKRSPVGP